MTLTLFFAIIGWLTLCFYASLAVGAILRRVRRSYPESEA